MLKTPSLLERAQALILDAVLIVAAMFLISYLFSQFRDVPDSARMYAFIFLFVVYDPLFTSFGGTLGHRAMGLRVKKEKDPTKNINILTATIRFAIKASLGTISLLTIASDSNGKAIHDFAVNSVVIYKSQEE
ncbi:RDD family protein [Paracrocinitomix mangrovi]|uniref:RDD family protein n=1 Tax=Paracrocinitomix mangrovi TaxID=2862509 RepID=UPI001C8E2284|nr:RDD family protein [Paracrocinitomix mangrovi]UKN02997.1 RDD family protein [Paracrocinitomix mangrovi]